MHTAFHVPLEPASDDDDLPASEPMTDDQRNRLVEKLLPGQCKLSVPGYINMPLERAFAMWDPNQVLGYPSFDLLRLPEEDAAVSETAWDENSAAWSELDNAIEATLFKLLEEYPEVRESFFLSFEIDGKYAGCSDGMQAQTVMVPLRRDLRRLMVDGTEEGSGVDKTWSCLPFMVIPFTAMALGHLWKREFDLANEYISPIAVSGWGNYQQQEAARRGLRMVGSAWQRLKEKHQSTHPSQRKKKTLPDWASKLMKAEQKRARERIAGYAVREGQEGEEEEPEPDEETGFQTEWSASSEEDVEGTAKSRTRFDPGQLRIRAKSRAPARAPAPAPKPATKRVQRGRPSGKAQTTEATEPEQPVVDEGGPKGRHMKWRTAVLDPRDGDRPSGRRGFLAQRRLVARDPNDPEKVAKYEGYTVEAPDMVPGVDLLDLPERFWRNSVEPEPWVGTDRAGAVERRHPHSKFPETQQKTRYGRKPAPYVNLWGDFQWAVGQFKTAAGNAEALPSRRGLQALLEAVTESLELVVVALYLHGIGSNPRSNAKGDCTVGHGEYEPLWNSQWERSMRTRSTAPNQFREKMPQRRQLVWTETMLSAASPYPSDRATIRDAANGLAVRDLRNTLQGHAAHHAHQTAFSAKTINCELKATEKSRGKRVRNEDVVHAFDQWWDLLRAYVYQEQRLRTSAAHLDLYQSPVGPNGDFFDLQPQDPLVLLAGTGPVGAALPLDDEFFRVLDDLVETTRPLDTPIPYGVRDRFGDSDRVKSFWEETVRIVDARPGDQPPAVMTNRIAMASVFLSATRIDAQGRGADATQGGGSTYLADTAAFLRVPISTLRRIEPVFGRDRLGEVTAATAEAERAARAYVQPGAKADWAGSWRRDTPTMRQAVLAELCEQYIVRRDDGAGGPTATVVGKQSEDQDVPGAEVLWQRLAEDGLLLDNQQQGAQTNSKWLYPETGCALAARLYVAKKRLCEQTDVVINREHQRQLSDALRPADAADAAERHKESMQAEEAAADEVRKWRLIVRQASFRRYINNCYTSTQFDARVSGAKVDTGARAQFENQFYRHMCRQAGRYLALERAELSRTENTEEGQQAFAEWMLRQRAEATVAACDAVISTLHERACTHAHQCVALAEAAAAEDYETDIVSDVHAVLRSEHGKARTHCSPGPGKKKARTDGAAVEEPVSDEWKWPGTKEWQVKLARVDQALRDLGPSKDEKTVNEAIIKIVDLAEHVGRTPWEQILQMRASFGAANPKMRAMWLADERNQHLDQERRGKQEEWNKLLRAWWLHTQLTSNRHVLTVSTRDMPAKVMEKLREKEGRIAQAVEDPDDCLEQALLDDLRRQQQRLEDIYRLLVSSAQVVGEQKKPRGLRAERAFTQDRTSFKPFDATRHASGKVGEVVAFSGGRGSGSGPSKPAPPTATESDRAGAQQRPLRAHAPKLDLHNPRDWNRSPEASRAADYAARLAVMARITSAALTNFQHFSKQARVLSRGNVAELAAIDEDEVRWVLANHQYVLEVADAFRRQLIAEVTHKPPEYGSADAVRGPDSADAARQFRCESGLLVKANYIILEDGVLRLPGSVDGPGSGTLSTEEQRTLDDVLCALNALIHAPQQADSVPFVGALGARGAYFSSGGERMQAVDVEHQQLMLRNMANCGEIMVPSTAVKNPCSASCANAGAGTAPPPLLKVDLRGAFDAAPEAFKSFADCLSQLDGPYGSAKPASRPDADAEVYPSLYRGPQPEPRGWTPEQRARSPYYFHPNGWKNGNLYFDFRVWPSWQDADYMRPGSDYATYQAQVVDKRREYDQQLFGTSSGGRKQLALALQRERLRLGIDKASRDWRDAETLMAFDPQQMHLDAVQARGKKRRKGEQADPLRVVEQ